MNNSFITPDWPAPKNIKAYTSLRHSEVGLIQQTSAINKSLLQKALDLPSEPIWIHQTHSTIALNAISENIGKEADATYTNQAQHVCAILTADCLPVLICDKQGKHVAAAHAGWRGLANGIIENTLAKLKLHAEDTLIWLGPAIGPQKFEVRRDVYDAFVQTHSESATCFTAISEEHWLADIYALARVRLHKLGIKNIYGGNLCTYSDQINFYSYRRDAKTTGRMLSLIWLSE